MNTLTPTDVYKIVNDIAQQATGRKDLTAVDTSSFVTVGETLLRIGTENTINAISTVLAKTIFSVRPYKSKFSMLMSDNEKWGAMTRKIVPLPIDAEESQDWNTNENNHINNGQTVDMYKINAKKFMQFNFYGTKVMQFHITRYRDQLSLAFTSESEFSRFIDAIMTDVFNDIETAIESESRATLLNYMAGLSSMKLYEVDLTKEFNTKYGTTYTKTELLSTHISDFMKFFASQVKIYSERLTDRSSLYHANPLNSKILRFTPKNKQKMFMYSPIFIEAESMVYSSLFNPKYLDIGSFEGVNYWQSPNDPMSINITPNILDISTGESKTAEAPVALPTVIGVLFDTDAVGINIQFDYTSTTPFNSAGGYWNTYYHYRRNFWNDFTENGILFVMGAGGK